MIQKDEMVEKPKKYFKASDNREAVFMKDFFKVDDLVIVTDGSYMLDEFGERVNGCDFQKDGKHELLKVVRINIPFKTDYGHLQSLGYHNNCEIQGYDGRVYHCSKINIENFKR